MLNGGSSSIRFALYDAADPARTTLSGNIDRIGGAGAILRVARGPGDDRSGEHSLDGRDHPTATGALLDWLDTRGLLRGIAAVGHRVVHGMGRTEPERVTPTLLDALRHLVPIDPDHLPAEIAMIEQATRRLPSVPQFVCFDTAFHRTLPRVAQLLAIPRRYDANGVRRYGFHGLSYAFVLEELARRTGPPSAESRVVLAHLGSGASMAAVLGGRSIDTTMGFTPTAGLPMSTRSGDLDPGVAAYLARTEQRSAADFFSMASHASGLLGVSETSADMRDLLAAEATDVRAAEAVALFCYQAKKCVGAYAAALGGLDALVFTGGIGERADTIRARICDGLGFLGMVLDAARNAVHADVISTDTSRVVVHVVRTDEASMIARSVSRLLASPQNQDPPR